MSSEDANTNSKNSSLLPLMAASAGAGMVARIPCHPIDTCKSRLQVQVSPEQASKIAKAAAQAGIPAPKAATYAYRHFGDAFVQIVKTEGIQGLYRGFGITFWGSAPASCLYFTTFELTKADLIARTGNFSENSSVIDFIAGFVAETVACMLYVPVDVLKERLQVQVYDADHHTQAAGRGGGKVSTGAEIASVAADSYYKSSVDAVKKVVKGEGIAGLYRGYFATLASFGPFSALYFMFYKQLKEHVTAAATPAVTTTTTTAPVLAPTAAQSPKKEQCLTTKPLSFLGSIICGAGGVD